MTLTLTKEQAADLETRMAQSRSNWERNTALLADDVQAWAEQAAAARGWRVERIETELAEEVVGGAYRVPVVTLHAPQGRVDLYAWPSLFRVMLLHKPLGKGHGLEWVVRTESGINWPQPWSQDTFLTLAEGLLNA